MKQFEEDFYESLKWVKRVCGIIGIPIYITETHVSPRQRTVNLMHFVIFSGFQLGVIVSLVMYLVAAESLTFLDKTEVLACICYNVINCVKLVAVRSMITDVNQLIAELRRLFPEDEKDEEVIQLVKRDLRNVKVTVLIIIIINMIFVTNWSASSIISMTIEYFRYGTWHKLLPFYLWFPWNTETILKYISGYICQVVLAMSSNVGASAPDAFFLAMAHHIVLQFKLLQLKIQQNIKLIVPEEFYENLDIQHGHHEELYSNMADYIKIHKDLIKLQETVESIFTLSVLVNFISSSIMICCVGFQATIIRGMRAAVFVVFLLTGLTQTLLICRAGETMIEESNAIGDAIYNSPWYLTDKKYRHMTFFMILRAQRPQVFTALRFSVVCLRSYASIIRSSYSYFTLLNTSYKK